MPLLPPDGTIVKAKRLGWDEELTLEQEFDMEPYEDKDYESDDLEGPITVVPVPAQPGYDAFASCLVGGQEADPTTVKLVNTATKNFNPDHDELGRFASHPNGRLVGKLENDAKEQYAKANATKKPKEYKKLVRVALDTKAKGRYAKELWKSLKMQGYHKDNIHEITEKDQNDLKDHLASYTGLKREDNRITSIMNDVLDHYDYDPDNPVHNTER